jgi:branched-chain amino acid transport system ATP-binding protein
MLEIDNVSVVFGGLVAVKELSFSVEPGRIVGLIGPNGAGKTTVFNAILAVYPPTSGEVRLNGRRIDRLPTHRICRLGIGRTFQNIRLFKSMSVLDNVKVALHRGFRYSLIDSLLRTPRCRRLEREIEAAAWEILEYFDLTSVARDRASSLPYGKQKYLEIARAYATRPKMLLLDEPAAGLNAVETQALMAKVRKIMDETGCGVLLIEHDMRLVMGICENIIAIEYGAKISEGDATHIQNDPKVIEAYLGTKDEDDARVVKNLETEQEEPQA